MLHERLTLKCKYLCRCGILKLWYCKHTCKSKPTEPSWALMLHICSTASRKPCIRRWGRIYFFIECLLTHLHLVARIRMSGPIPLMILYAFLACTGIAFTFILLVHSFPICPVMSCFLHSSVKPDLNMGGFVWIPIPWWCKLWYCYLMPYRFIYWQLCSHTSKWHCIDDDSSKNW